MRRHLRAPSAGRFRLVTMLVGLAVFSMLCTALVQLTISHRVDKKALTETTLRLNYYQAAKISATIETLIQSMQGSLRTAARLLSVQGSEDIQDYLDLIRETSRYFNSVLWVDETGIVRDTSPDSIGTAGSPAQLQALKEALASRKPLISQPAVGPTGRLLIMMSEPIYDKAGNYRGLIGGTIFLQDSNVLTEILGYNPQGAEGSYYYVVDGRGRLLYHPDSSRIGEDVSDLPVVMRIRRGEEGSMHTVNTEGEVMLAGFRPVRGISWGVVQQTPIEAVNEQMQANTRTTGFSLLIPSCIVLLLTMLFARMLATPFIRLADIVKQMSAGHAVDVPKDRRRWTREAELIARKVMQTSDQFQRSRRQLERAAVTDSLTGLGNRRAFQHDIEVMMNEHERFSMIVLDIDHFKSINDTFGHHAGDEMIKELAATIAASMRDSDSCSRYGGDEFVILLPDTPASKAYKAAEKLRRNVEMNVRSFGRPVTISLGIAEYPLHADDPDELFEMADQALYRSKENGKNRATIAVQPRR